MPSRICRLAKTRRAALLFDGQAILDRQLLESFVAMADSFAFSRYLNPRDDPATIAASAHEISRRLHYNALSAEGRKGLGAENGRETVENDAKL
jgi:hypothetical protein